MIRHSIKSDDAIDEGGVIASVMPASTTDVKRVLNAPIGTGDGRSAWAWVRLSNGDLILGIFPQGDTYISLEGLNI